MKKIIFVRHARAVKDNSIPDKDRPLQAKGAQSAQAIVKDLSSEGLSFDLIATSPAMRAVETARFFAQTMTKGSDRIIVVPEWYESMPVKSFLAWIRDIPDFNSTVVIIGHNPDLSLLIRQFDTSFSDHIPPAGAVVLSFPTDTWDAVSSVHAETVLFKIPSDAADFKEKLKLKEGEITERLTQVSMQTLRGLSGANHKLCEKHVKEYAGRLAGKAVKDMQVVTVIGRWF